MTNPSGNPMNAVASLMLERQRYEQWLAALENKRAITPPNVFERVRADYEARLKAVTDQLLGRTEELKETISTLTARLARLQTEESRRREERYESELRAAVGEMTPEGWQALLRESESEVTRIASERANVTSELARLHQILSMAEAKGTALAAGEDGRGQSPAGGPVGTPSRASSFDELAFLKSVVEPHASRGGVASESQSDGARPESASGDDGRKASPTGASGNKPRTAPKRDVDAVPSGAGGAAPAKPEGAEESGDDEENAVPAYLKDVPTEDVKTLKCAECSAMNYPTEWYCERCGAELAAM